MTSLLPVLRLLAKGNAKALAGGLAAGLLTLAGSADGGLTLAEILTALAALFGGTELVRRIPNTGPKANATEVPLVGDVVAFAPFGEITRTDVQAALEEIVGDIKGDPVGEVTDAVTDLLDPDPDVRSRISVDEDSIARAVSCCLDIRVDGKLVGREEEGA